MKNIKLPPIDVLYPQNVTAVILYLERAVGYTENEVIEWFRENYADFVIHCQKYYESRKDCRPCEKVAVYSAALEK